MAALLGVLSPLAPGAVCQPPANCQQPDQEGHGSDGVLAAISDANPIQGTSFEVQDNFFLNNGGNINAVCWWGVYLHFDDPKDPGDATSDCSPGEVPDVFTITYFDNTPGLPGEPGPVLAGPFNVTATLTKTATGNVIPSTAGDLVEFRFTATHPGVPISAGRCAWIMIRANTAGASPPCYWLWSTAPAVSEDGLGDGLSFLNGQENDYDLAFCANTALGDPAACSLPINPGCAGATNICNQEPSPEPGCADPECCTVICAPASQGGAGLAFCCVVQWNQLCVNAAVNECGPPSGCGVVDSGSCFIPHDKEMTPYCDDAECCATVCAVDPYCCGEDPLGVGWWDLACVIEALQFCNCTAPDAPPNDLCSSAISIGLGDTPIENTCATSSPPSHASCNDGFLTGLGLDIWYKYTAGFTGQLLVSTCGQVSYDTQLAVYQGCNCAALSNPPLACNNDGAVCLGGSSQLVVNVQSGTCYLIRVGSTHLFPSGSGTLTLSTDIPAPCDLGPIPPGALAEGEACGADSNGGCDNLPDPATFRPVEFGDTIHGTAWANGGNRDTDWYELVLTETAEIGLTVEAEFPAIFGIIETEPPGSGSCADSTGFLDPAAFALPCEETSIATTLGPGTWWVFVSVNSGSGFPCAGAAGNDYLLTVAGPPCPWDCDGSDDGNVNVTDLLALIGQYDVQAPTVCDGGSCDYDGNGCVDVTDLLKLLSHYTTHPTGIGCP